jgi:hypothetical protein
MYPIGHWAKWLHRIEENNSIRQPISDDLILIVAVVSGPAFTRAELSDANGQPTGDESFWV